MHPPMHVTIDQARTLDALELHGSVAAAAKSLHKGHTAVLYALTALEEQTGLPLVDRSGYRATLTPAGKRVLEECRRLLAAERSLLSLCEELRTGWEPALTLVHDGIVPLEPILSVVARLVREGAPTRLSVTAEFLSGVEQAFLREDLALMLSVLPPTTTQLASVPMPPIEAKLVAHRDHPIIRRGKAPSDADLAEFVLITVRGSDPRLLLSTATIAHRSTVSLNDFSSKKQAILSGIGYGWLPEHFAEPELSQGDLAVVRFKGGFVHTFRPRLYYKPQCAAGRAASTIVSVLGKSE